MIISYNPVIVADKNLICAGREPDESDLAAIRRARAVILSQGSYGSLYRMARENCPHVFPNMDIRFDYPGKSNQIRLFRRLGLAHPPTRLFASTNAFKEKKPCLDFPLVLKLDWGGEGKTVFKADDPASLARILDHVQACEQTNQHGFLIQAFIPCNRRSLRVAVIGDQTIAYWRIQSDKQPFGTALSQGALIDRHSRLDLQTAAKTVVRDICRKTGLQLAGFDFIFDDRTLRQGQILPLMLEINFFFGRTGLGGSEAYYDLYQQAVDEWLVELKLK
jgi:ribosomal protein S6--L-glutamate ligase